MQRQRLEGKNLKLTYRGKKQTSLKYDDDVGKSILKSTYQEKHGKANFLLEMKQIDQALEICQ